MQFKWVRDIEGIKKNLYKLGIPSAVKAADEMKEKLAKIHERESVRFRSLDRDHPIKFVNKDINGNVTGIKETLSRSDRYKRFGTDDGRLLDKFTQSEKIGICLITPQKTPENAKIVYA